MMPIDLTGQRFGRLRVIERAPAGLKRASPCRAAWICECDCGKTKVVLGANLRAGATRSCGCYRREVSIQNGKNRKGKKYVRSA